VTRHGLRTPLSSTDQRNEWRCEHDQLLVQHYADDDDALRLTHSDEPLPDHVPANLLTRRKLLHGRQKLRGAHARAHPCTLIRRRIIHQRSMSRSNSRVLISQGTVTWAS
jgi:hypothetical protein